MPQPNRSSAPNSKVGRSRRANDEGVRLHLAGDRDRARQAYQRSIALDPDNATAHHNLAFLLTQAGAADEGLAHAERAVALRPGNAGYLTTLGQVRLVAGDGEGAVAALEAAVRADPGDLTARDQLGRVQLQSGRVDDAVSTFEQTAADAGYDALRQVRWATAECLRGDLEVAAAMLREVVRRSPDLACGWSQLGVVLYMLEDYGSARDALRQALGIDRHDRQALRHLALVETACNRRGEALRALGDYLALQPDDEVAALDFAVLLLSVGRAREARQVIDGLGDDRAPPERLAFYSALADSELGAKVRARRVFARLARNGGPYAARARSMLAA